MRYRSLIRNGFIALLAFIFAIMPVTIVPFTTQIVRAQNSTPQNGAVTASFIDYYAEATQLKGHEGSVNGADFSPDGKLIVTAGVDRTARIWDLSGKESTILKGHTGSVRSAKFSPDGQRIVTASFDGTARVWDLSGKLLAELKGHQGKVNSANFSPNGKLIVTAGEDKTARLWDISGVETKLIPSGKPSVYASLQGHESPVYGARFSPDGKLIVTASADKTARIWDLSGVETRNIASLQGHTDTVWSASFSPDGKKIVTASDDKTARVWDISGKQLAILEGHKNSVYGASFSQDSKRIVTASLDYTGFIWEASGKLTAKLKQHQGGVNSASFSADGKFIVTASVDQTARVWDLSGKLITSLVTQDCPINEANFSADGNLIVTTSQSMGNICLWNLSNRQITTLPEKDLVLPDDFLPDGFNPIVRFSADGKLILITSIDGNARVWDATGKLLSVLKHPVRPYDNIKGASFSYDSKFILTVLNKTARVWNTSGKQLVEIPESDDASFSQDGKFIVTASANTQENNFDKIISLSQDGKFILAAGSKIRLWNTSGKLLNQFSEGKNSNLSQNDNKAFYLWNINGKLIEKLQDTKSAIFSPDNKLIITTSFDGKTARVLNTAGKQLHVLDGVERASFSFDGKLILTTSYKDKTASVWSTNGKLLASSKNQDVFNTTNFNPNGNIIYTVISSELFDFGVVLNSSGKIVAKLENDRSLSFSLNGEMLTKGGENNEIARILNFSDKCLVSFFQNLFDVNSSTIAEPQQESEKVEISGTIAVESARFSPDNKLVLTTSDDTITRLWDTSGKLLAELKGHTFKVKNYQFSPDSKLIITTSNDVTLVWDTTGNLIAKLDNHGEASFSPDSKQIITVSSGVANIWDTTGKLLTQLRYHNQDKSIRSVRFSPDNKQIIILYDDGIVSVWDISGKLLAESKIPVQIENQSYGSILSPDGRLIITTAEKENFINIWDIHGKLITKIQTRQPIFVNSIKLSADSKLIVFDENNTAHIWDTTGKFLTKIKDIGNILSLANFSADNYLIITTSMDAETAFVWDITGKLLMELQGHKKFLSDANLSYDGLLIVTASVDGTARIWNRAGKQISTLNAPLISINTASFSPDGQKIITTSENNNVQVWDNKGNLLFELKEHQDFITSATFSPDSKFVLTASGDGTARLWDLSGKQLSIIKENKRIGANFSPDGKSIITVSDFKNVRIWNLSGKLLAELKADKTTFISSAIFSPDGKYIFTYGNEGTARIWNQEGKLVSELKLSGQNNSFTNASFSFDSKLILTKSSHNEIDIWKVSGELFKKFLRTSGPVVPSFSPDNKLILTTDGTAKLRDLSGKLELEIQRRQGYIFNAKFSPNGQFIITWGDDKVQVWDISGNQLGELKGHQNSIATAEFSSDSTMILTTSRDGTARIWNTSGKQLYSLKFSSQTALSPKAKADRLKNQEFQAPNCGLALEPWQQALKIYQQINDNENQTLMLEKLGNAYYCLGDYTSALNFYSQAVNKAQEFKYPLMQVKNLSKLGKVYTSLANYPQAIEYYNQALKITETQKVLTLKTTVLRERGNVYQIQGKYQEAIPNYLQALALDEADKNSLGIADNKINLANIYLALGDISKATQYYKEASEFKYNETLPGLGDVELFQGNIKKAIDFYNKSLAYAQQQENKSDEINALNKLGLAYSQLGSFAIAEKYLRDSIKVGEELRIKLDDINKISIFEQQAYAYVLLQKVLITQNKIQEALEIAERGRARAFVELLSKRVSGNSQNEVTSPLPANIEKIKQIAKAQNATLVQYTIVTDNSQPNTAHQTKESSLYIWVIKPTGEVSFREVNLKSVLAKENINLAELVTTARESFGVSRNSRQQFIVSRPDVEKEQKELQIKRLKQLYQLLITPITDALNTNQRTIFIPQGELFLVPFPALLDEQGKYLVDKYTIQTAPSIQVLDLTYQQKRRQSNQANNNQALIVGNPTMPSVEIEAGKPPVQLSNLPKAKQEAEKIATLLKTQALTGNQATKAAIVQRMQLARIIHLATHGILDNIRGLGSALAFTPSGNDNGLLTADEILNLPLTATNMVVLSACNTGRGRITGDGVIGLSRSFISAGVPSVVVSLWAVPDDATAFLMTEFYQNLDKKLDKATALQKAMQTTKLKYPNPRQWAAFTLIGEAG